MNIVEVVRVRFRWPGKMYEFRNPLALPLKRGNQVVVQTDEGDELIGTVMIAPRLRLARGEDDVLPSILRTASDRELGTAEVADDYRLEIKNYFDTRMRSREMNGVKLVDIEKANGGQKLILYFASEQKRFNYRDLAVEMAQRFGVRVDMRPVGIRDAARLSGGIGKCGLSLCCSTWLPDFQQISIRMAKDQGLSLDPESINGQCGRLLCCLGYEHQNYVEMGQGLPKVGKAVVTPKGDARVVKLDIIQGRITVRFEDGAYEIYQSSEVKRKFGPGGQSSDDRNDDDDSPGEGGEMQARNDSPRSDDRGGDSRGGDRPQFRDQNRDQPRDQNRDQSREPRQSRDGRDSNRQPRQGRDNQGRDSQPRSDNRGDGRNRNQGPRDSSPNQNFAPRNEAPRGLDQSARNDQPRGDQQPSNDQQPRGDQARSDQPRSDFQPRNDQARNDQPRNDNRQPRDNNDRGPRRRGGRGRGGGGGGNSGQNRGGSGDPGNRSS